MCVCVWGGIISRNLKSTSREIRFKFDKVMAVLTPLYGFENWTFVTKSQARRIEISQTRCRMCPAWTQMDIRQELPITTTYIRNAWAISWKLDGSLSHPQTAVVRMQIEGRKQCGASKEALEWSIEAPTNLVLVYPL